MLIEIYLYFILFLIIFRYSTLVVDDIRSSVSKFPHRILKVSYLNFVPFFSDTHSCVAVSLIPFQYVCSFAAHSNPQIMSTWNQNQTYSLFAPMGNYILNVNKDLHHSLKKYSS